MKILLPHLLSALALCSALNVEKLNYTLIQSTGKFCPERDTCQVSRGAGRSPPDGLENDWKKRNCFCDRKCDLYGDCCIDAAAYNRQSQKNNFRRFQCKNLRQYGDVYVRSHCVDTWPQLDKIRERCEAEELLQSDPFGATPVTNQVSGVTYRNYYCAVCNHDSHDISFWRPRLECPSLNNYYSRFKNITIKFIEERLTFDKHRNRWGIKVDTGGIPVFHECNIDPAAPDNLLGLVRPCPGKSTIGRCPDGYEDERTRYLCESYTAMVFEPNWAYRNVHCAICNNATLTKLICLNLGPFGRFNWQQNFNSRSFAILFDISGDQKDYVGFSKHCQDGHLYDPFFKKCRNVVCAKDYEIFRNNTCIDPQIRPTTTTAITSAPTTASSTSTTEDTTSTISFADLNESTQSDSTRIKDSTILPITNEAISETSTYSSEFLGCPKFLLQKEEFEIKENGQAFVKYYDKHYQIGHFEVNEFEGTLTICATEGQTHGMKFSDEMGYVTFVCLGISIICCLMHIAASIISPELQNLSGKNLLSLTVALLGSYICFIGNMFMHKPVTSECYVLAVFMYFFFLASFFWMLVIAVDVSRSLKLATTQLRLITGNQWKKFGFYSIIGWISPMILVISAIIMDLAGPENSEYRPGFGETELCWFSQKKGLLVFFALPFSLIMVTNLMLFVSTASLVFNTTQGSAKVTRNCGPKTNFNLYLRLAVIMGITWITGLIAGFMDSETAWFAFIALNTLQGLFIFIAFTCTKKVRSNLKEILCSKDLTEDPSWKLTISTKRSNLDSQDSKVVKSDDQQNMDHRGKTMYTVSNYQANCSLTQNSFDGRYY